MNYVAFPLTSVLLPNSLQVYCADVGYLVDGTDLACAGNNFAKAGACWHVGYDSHFHQFIC